MSQYASEVKSGQRFEFGKNWSRFLTILDEPRILEAEHSLRQMLEVEDLRGKRFLDIGSGSGLFSLAARRLGAQVHSFDYDPHSAACTQELKQRFFPEDANWRIEEGSALDADYIGSLGLFDVVYSWGVLHHTGAMWDALQKACLPVAPGGKLFIAIYNDQGATSRQWTRVKKLYNHLPGGFKSLILWPTFVRLWGPTTLRDFLRGKPFHTWRHYTRRGMSPLRDVIDWVGGYPFEVAKPEEVFDFCRNRGFTLTRLKTCGKGHGCNEFVFENQ